MIDLDFNRRHSRNCFFYFFISIINKKVLKSLNEMRKVLHFTGTKKLVKKQEVEKSLVS